MRTRKNKDEIKLINIEGIDGTGKHSVAQKLVDIYELQGYSVTMMDFPAYDTPTGKLVKEYLDGKVIKDPDKANAFLCSMYYSIDRLSYYENNLNIFKESDIIISDRSYMSNIFFQGSKYLRNIKQNLSSANKAFTSEYYEYIYLLVRPYLVSMSNIEVNPLYMHLCNNNDKFKVYNMYLYHEDINMNLKLMSLRNREKDLFEKNIEFLKSVKDFSEFLVSDYLVKFKDDINNRNQKYSDIDNHINNAFVYNDGCSYLSEFNYMPIKCSSIGDDMPFTVESTAQYIYDIITHDNILK